MALQQVSINYLSVLVASIASFVLGMLWYGPLFGKYWMKMMGFTKDSIKKMKLTPAKAMSLGFIITIIMAYVLAHFVKYLDATTFTDAAQLAFWLWIGIQIPLAIGSFLWEGKSFQLFIFNAAYRLVEIIIIISILALWP
jgi:hypothetical protein